MALPLVSLLPSFVFYHGHPTQRLQDFGLEPRSTVTHWENRNTFFFFPHYINEQSLRARPTKQLRIFSNNYHKNYIKDRSARFANIWATWLSYLTACFFCHFSKYFLVFRFPSQAAEPLKKRSFQGFFQVSVAAEKLFRHFTCQTCFQWENSMENEVEF